MHCLADHRVRLQICESTSCGISAPPTSLMSVTLVEHGAADGRPLLLEPETHGWTSLPRTTPEFTPTVIIAPIMSTLWMPTTHIRGTRTAFECHTHRRTKHQCLRQKNASPRLNDCLASKSTRSGDEGRTTWRVLGRSNGHACAAVVRTDVDTKKRM